MSLIEASHRRPWRCLATVAVVASVVGCTIPPHRAPVEERTATPRATVAAAIPAASAASVPESRPAAPDNAGRPGYYTVKPGDTLIRIGLDNGQNWKDLVRWNNLENPNIIEVGQVLRVIAPGADATVAASRPVVTARAEPRPPEPRPLDVKPPVATAPASALPVQPPVPTAVASGSNQSAPPPLTPSDSDDDIVWAWPAPTPVTTPFDDARNKGLDFRGKPGDPVLAAADGRVVYAGSGLRGYGNLVILKHNATYLTAYAHNQTLLVKDDQTVRRGQKIAEMGSTDADSVQLHFEIRKQGKPIDPARLLPPR